MIMGDVVIVVAVMRYIKCLKQVRINVVFSRLWCVKFYSGKKNKNQVCLKKFRKLFLRSFWALAFQLNGASIAVPVVCHLAGKKGGAPAKTGIMMGRDRVGCLASCACLWLPCLILFLEYNTAPARLCSFFFWSFDAVAMDEVFVVFIGSWLEPCMFSARLLSLSLPFSLPLSLYARHLPSPPVWP